MNRWQFLLGRVTVEITSADSAALLNALTTEKIRLQDVKYCDGLTLRASVSRQDRKALLAVADKHGANVKTIGVSGLFLTVAAMCKRPVLMAFLIGVFLLACFLPSRILFVSVEGNVSVPDRYILEVAAECGIGFGAERRQVRSEIMKNKLLERIPQLQWAGINTTGCTAIISVREKTAQETQTQPKNQVSSIVASRDGIIQNCTVYQGNPLCTVGQAVKAGQTLVSGYLDCGIVTKTTQADAEIKALTFRELEVVTPAATVVKGKCVEKKIRYSLRIGKNLIKFYKDSGNSDATCGKIYSEEYVRLPGGFTLPIAIITETVLYYEDTGEKPVGSDGEDWLAGFVQTYLKDSMISGEIISADTAVNPVEDGCFLYGKFTCMEMIGQVKYEQTLTRDESDD